MPLGEFENEVLRRLAAQRSPDSYVAGATVLHQSPNSPRASQDIDLFHDEEEAVNVAAQADIQELRRTGFLVELQPPLPGFVRAIISAGGKQTKIEWVRDSAFRFFPIEPDSHLGWRLNLGCGYQQTPGLRHAHEIEGLFGCDVPPRTAPASRCAGLGGGWQGPRHERRVDH